jgi:hypothetical protein
MDIGLLVFLPVLGAIVSLLTRLKLPGPDHVQIHALVALIAPAICLLLLLRASPVKPLSIRFPGYLKLALPWLSGLTASVGYLPP